MGSSRQGPSSRQPGPGAFPRVAWMCHLVAALSGARSHVEDRISCLRYNLENRDRENRVCHQCEKNKPWCGALGGSGLGPEITFARLSSRYVCTVPEVRVPTDLIFRLCDLKCSAEREGRGHMSTYSRSGHYYSLLKRGRAKLQNLQAGPSPSRWAPGPSVHSVKSQVVTV